MCTLCLSITNSKKRLVQKGLGSIINRCQVSFGCPEI